MKRHIALAFVAVAVAVAGASPASAADVQPGSPCYPAGEAPTFAGSGWTPGAAWTLTDAAGAVVATATVDAEGNVAATVPAPQLAAKRRTPLTSALTASDGTLSASTTLRVVNAGALWNDRGQPRRLVRWQFNRLAPGEPIYVHVRRGSRTVKTTRVGRASGPCGTATKRLRRLPVRPSTVRDGNYRIYVDNRRRFSPGGLQYLYPYDVSTSLRF